MTRNSNCHTRLLASLLLGVGTCAGGCSQRAEHQPSQPEPDPPAIAAHPTLLQSSIVLTDVTAQTGVTFIHFDGSGGSRYIMETMSAGLALFDFDGDGLVDIYLLNGAALRGTHYDHPPRNALYRNNGDGTFADISQQSGIASRAGTSMGMIALDANGNGFTDVLVVNDVMANFLFENDGQGNFREVGVASGLAFDASGLPQSSMGVDCGDYDNDGRLDLYVTSYRDELTVLYRNMGNGFFLDFTRASRAGDGSLPYVTWGTGFVDFDNDGDRDLFVACGHTEDNIELHDPSASYRAPNLLLKNQLIEPGEAQFVNVSAQRGDGLRPVHASRGAGFDDLDNDGRVDVVVLNVRQQPTILRNESPGDNRWLQIQLRGVRSNRDGVGARVQVAAGDLQQTAEVHSGRGYQSHWGTRLHFGLGNRSGADRVQVHWPGGGTDVLEHVSANQRLTIIEGTTTPGRNRSPSAHRR